MGFFSKLIGGVADYGAKTVTSMIEHNKSELVEPQYTFWIVRYRHYYKKNEYNFSEARYDVRGPAQAKKRFREDYPDRCYVIAEIVKDPNQYQRRRVR